MDTVRIKFGIFLLILLCTHGNFCVDEDILIRKISEAISISASNYLIPLNEEIFDYYLNSGPKNYSFIIVIGTEVVECDLCRVVQDNLRNIAQSWIYENPSMDNLFFGFIDFSENQNLINRLNIVHAPFIIHFPPVGSPKSVDKLDDLQIHLSPERLARWIFSRTGRQVNVQISRDYTTLKVLIAVLSVSFLPVTIGLIAMKTVIALLVLVFIVSMLSGAMWITINSPPWTIDEDSQKKLYMDSPDGQLVFEAVIIFGLYSCTSLGVVLLTQKCTKRRGFKRVFTIISALAMAVLGFNQLAEYYALKHGYLPYHVSLL